MALAALRMATGSNWRSNILKEDDLADIFEMLYPVRQKHVPLGLQIGVKMSEIHAVAKKYTNPSEILLEILSCRLGKFQPLTWADIAHALRSRSVNESKLADNILKRYVPRSFADEHKAHQKGEKASQRSKEQLQASQATSPLSVDDLRELFEILYPLRTKCNMFGLRIGVKMQELERIEAKYVDCAERLLEILACRLKMFPDLTWVNIVEALKSPIVGEHKIADSIQKKYGIATLQTVKSDEESTSSEEVDTSSEETVIDNLSMSKAEDAADNEISHKGATMQSFLVKVESENESKTSEEKEVGPRMKLKTKKHHQKQVREIFTHRCMNLDTMSILSFLDKQRTTKKQTYQREYTSWY